MSEHTLTLPLHDLVIIKTITELKHTSNVDKHKMLKAHMENYRLSAKDIDKIIDDEYSLGRVGKDEIC